MEISEILANWAQAIGVPIAAAALVVAAWNTIMFAKTSEDQFWLDIRKSFNSFIDIHTALCPNGKWHGVSGFPSSSLELRRLEAYMGLLEYLNIMLTKGTLKWKTFENQYAYRIRNIIANPYIVQAKLINAAGGWLEFLELVKKVNNKPLKGTDLPFNEWPRVSLSDP